MKIIDTNKAVRILLGKLKAFSPTTYYHSIRVSNLCVSFGKTINLGEDDIENLQVAGLLHDIGKLNIPDNILHKPSKLSIGEYQYIKRHPKYGVELLLKAGVTDLNILNLVLSHHERPDGLGYPNAIKNNDISYLANILVICDCFDAMSQKRVYKDIKDLEYIKKELLNNAGKQFDYDLVYLFMLYLDNELNKNESIKKNVH